MKNIVIMKSVKLIVLLRTNSIKFEAAAKGLARNNKVGIINPQVMKNHGDNAAVKYKLVLKILKYSRNLCSFFLSAAIQTNNFLNTLNWINHKITLVTLD